MKKVLILGGTGAMGKHLVEKLVDSEYLVFVSSREEHESYRNVIYLKGDAKDSSFLYPLLKTEHFHSIFNFMTYTTDHFEIVVNILLKATDHYFFLSSSRVYADSEELLCESSPRLLDAINDQEYLSTDNYALAKARQEDILRHSGTNNWTIIRPYLTYSESRLQLGIFEQNTWLLRALKGKIIIFSKDLADKYTTLTYGADVAEVMIRLIGNKKALGETIQITCNQSLKWSEVLSIYLDELQIITGKDVKVKLINKAPINILPRELWTLRYDRLFNRRFNNSKLESILGEKFNFTPPEVGLRKCLKSFVEQPNEKGYSWEIEAMMDKVTGEMDSPRVLFSPHYFISYIICRYLNPSIIYKLKEIKNKVKSSK